MKRKKKQVELLSKDATQAQSKEISNPIAVFSKLAPAKPSQVYETYWRFAAERQNVFFRRLAQHTGYWTEDPVLVKHKFTNAYRASDRASQFLIRNVIYKGDPAPKEVFFRTILFKLFNRIETWKCLENDLGVLSWRDFNYARYEQILNRALERGERIYSAAYIMPMAVGFEGSRKHQTHLRLLEHMMNQGAPEKLCEARSLRKAFELVRSYPMMGDFLAFQFTIDLNYGPILDFSEMDFVVPGPGARDGIRKCFSDLGGLSETDIIRVVADRQEAEFAHFGIDFKNLWGRALQLVDCQNLFCEVDKYARLVHPDVAGVSGRTRIKQTYKPTLEPIDYWYPPKWGINEAVLASMQPAKSSAGSIVLSRATSLNAVSSVSQKSLTYPNVSLQVGMQSHILPTASRHAGRLFLDEYQDFVRSSDKSNRSGREGCSFALLGLFGETGSLLSVLKKKHREAAAYHKFSHAIVEEFGDVLWYFTDLACHANMRLSLIARNMLCDDHKAPAMETCVVETFHDIQSSKPELRGIDIGEFYERNLLRLGAVAGEILSFFDREQQLENSPLASSLLAKFLRALVDAADAANINLETVAIENQKKVWDRWPIDRNDKASLFDETFDTDEQLPRTLEVLFTEKTAHGKNYVIQKCRGINIGDRLTDNMIEDDGYRFHDVFHLSYAAILGWSPVLRALLRCKRKSDPQTDEVQDGARAVIIEEGVSTWVFNHARERGFFEGLDELDYSLLKSVRRLVTGFEVERCPLWQWERAILEGFRVFRQLRKHRGGIVTADLLNRQLSYRVSL